MNYEGRERRAAPIEAATELVIREAVDKAFEKMTGLLGLYRTNGVCDERHKVLDDSASKDDLDIVRGETRELRKWLWGLFAAIVVIGIQELLHK